MDGHSDSARGGVAGFFAALILVMGIVAGVLGIDHGVLPIPWQSHPAATEVAEPPAPVPVQVLAPRPPADMNAVAAGVVPSIVDIVADVGPLGMEGAGTGIVVAPNGEVLTSHHVIKGAKHISVTDVVTGLVYSATPLGYDSSHDIALIKLGGANGLPAAKLGNSATIDIGEPVVAIGNAGGTGGTPTSVIGKATGLDATIVAENEADFSRKYLTGLIEIEADVTAGQSGGSLVDDTGAVVGVIAASSGAHAPDPAGTRGFAVPINTAMGIVNQIRTGRSSDTVHVGPTATLGVMISDSIAARGVRVDLALSGMPADGAGMTDGDTIDMFDGKPVDSGKDLRAAISAHKPGDTVAIGWTDAGGARHDASVQLMDGPPN